MRRAGWRVCDVRDLAGVDYTTAQGWRNGKREMRLHHVAVLMAAANKAGVKASISDFLVPSPKRRAA